jgi:hypothetical protein
MATPLTTQELEAARANYRGELIPAGRRDRAPGPPARHPRPGLYAARRPRPLLRPAALAVASGSRGSGLLSRRLVPVLQPAPAGLSTRAAAASAIEGPTRRHLAAIAGPVPEHPGKRRTHVCRAERCGNKVVRRFGLVFQLGEDLRELYRTFGHPLDLFNGAEGAQHLPVPATFLIDEKGLIRLAHVDVDYTRRLDPEDVIAALRQLRA